MLIQPNLIDGSIARAARGHFDPPKVEAALGEGERTGRMSPGRQQGRFSALLDQVGGDQAAAQKTLERLIGGNDLVSVNYLDLGVRAARSVCRIHLRDAKGNTTGFATGFLVAPGTLLTNHHVFPTAEIARLAEAEFDYEFDADGSDMPVVRFAIAADPAPIPTEALDFCLVAVSPRSDDGRHSIDEYGWLPLSPAPGKSVVGEYLTIIQHPAGERKQVCVRENKLLKYDEAGNTIWYATDTLGGSSGSPVFNNTWQVVSLHHSGVPRTDARGRWLSVDGTPWDSSMDESRVAWLANEGIRISRILEYLQARETAHPLTAAVVRAMGNKPVKPAPAERTMLSPGLLEARDGELRLTLPIQIGLRMSAPGFDQAFRPAIPLTRPEAPAAAHAIPSAAHIALLPASVESVSVDQTNYAKRTGYSPTFLGKGALAVPLPKVKGKHPELAYWNYTVVMNTDRRLAFFSAVNVDANLRPGDAGRDGDRWYTDTRIGEDEQIGQEFYGQQKEFEIDRSENPFDRGHLTRRLDAQWGTTAKLSKRSGDDSFHFTNCSPQHWKFNQGSKRWLGLEDYVVQAFASETLRACVINGPVFDAPLSADGPDGRPVPSFKGKRHKDPTFGDVAIPKLFFKVVACLNGEGALAAAGFLMSQEDLLATTARIAGMPSKPEEALTDAEAALYQVRIRDLAALTGLDFGPLAAAEVTVGDESLVGPVPIVKLEDIRIRVRTRQGAAAARGREARM